MRRRLVSYALVGTLTFSIMFSNVGSISNGIDSNEAVTTQAVENALISSKEEVIYSTLHADGNIKEIYSVNIFNVLGNGEIIDFGNFSSVKNLTNTNEITYSDGKVAVNADKGRFYYQGNLVEKELPWNISIVYILDGKEIPGNELAGKSGHLEILIKTSKNDKISSIFYDNYLVQISFSVDSDKCENIIAEDATFANAGSMKVVNFNLMPKKDADIHFSADVTDFLMSGISFAGIPFSMSVDTPDLAEMTDGLTTLSDAIKELNDGTKKLNTGAKELSDGTKDLGDGALEYKNGFGKLTSNSKDLVSGSKSILSALQYIESSLSSSGTSDLSSLSKLPDGLKEINTGLSKISKGITSLNDGFSKAYMALDGAIATIPEPTISEQDIYGLMVSNPENKALNSLVENYKAAQTVKATYEAVKQAFVAVNNNLPALSASIDQVSGALKQTADQIGESLKKNDISKSLNELSKGLKELSNNYGKFHTGLVEYTNGVKTLENGYGELYTGIEKLSEGTEKLSDGITELSDGTNELNKETTKMPDEMQTKIDEMLEEYTSLDFELESFISNKNTEVDSVQFVIQSESIKEEEETDLSNNHIEKETFWSRLVNLFSRENL